MPRPRFSSQLIFLKLNIIFEMIGMKNKDY